MKITFTHSAKLRLRNIYEYYSFEANRELAKKIRGQIFDVIILLKDNPFLGQIEELLSDLREGHRRLVKGNYKIIYKIKGDVIYITDIFDSRQDPAKIYP